MNFSALEQRVRLIPGYHNNGCLIGNNSKIAAKDRIALLTEHQENVTSTGDLLEGHEFLFFDLSHLFRSCQQW